MTPLIIVVGGGPAGLSAAAAAAQSGARTILLDEGIEVGGQLLYRLQWVKTPGAGPAARPGALSRQLVAEAQAAGVEICANCVVAGCLAGNELLVVRNGDAERMRCDALIVATGSTDLPYPFSGATFPGVFSARALQILLNQHRVRPGRRFAIIGPGDQAEELASDVLLAGGEVVWSGIAPAPFLEAFGRDGVHGLRVGQDRFAVDVIAIAVGRQPDFALATMAGTPLGFSDALGGLAPLLDERLQSPNARLFVAGDAAGVGSVADAIVEGRLAGAAAAAAVGLAMDMDVYGARAAGGEGLARRIAMRSSLTPIAVQPYE